MSEVIIDRILDDFTYLIPNLRKKFSAKNLNDVSRNLTHHHFFIMKILGNGPMKASDLAKLSCVPKSQMTLLIDQLVATDIVKRESDVNDRRVINLFLTEHGKAWFKEAQRKIIEEAKGTLRGLPQEDLEALSNSVRTLRNILSKIP